MTRRAFGAIVAVFLALWVGLECGYRIGKNSGYSQGWSDAHCGPDNTCEAGEE